MKIGIIGDIHAHWDASDTAFFNQAGYDALLFTGDLAAITHSLPVARQLAALTTPAWMIPGNHDGVTLAQLLAELKHRPWATRIGAIGMHRRVARLAAALGPVVLGGYSLSLLGDELGLIVARPHAMGGDRLYFRSYLKKSFGIDSLTDSAMRLKSIIDRAPQNLVILAHNGPAGLGDTPDAPFGCDFRPDLGDFGDRDLRAAIDHARRTGHRVRAVIAGHMHHRSKHTGEWRRSSAREADTLYINAARVPRIEAQGERRHHIMLDLDSDEPNAETRFVDNQARMISREPLAD